MMRLDEATRWVELTDLELQQICGSGQAALDPLLLGPGPGGELHARVSGPPLTGDIGGSYSDPHGNRLGGSISTDGQGWGLTIGGSLTSTSGRSSISGSAYSDGHDWAVKATYVHRF